MPFRSISTALRAREAEIARLDLYLTDRAHRSVVYRLATWPVAWWVRRRRARLEIEVSALVRRQVRRGRLELDRRGR